MATETDMSDEVVKRPPPVEFDSHGEDPRVLVKSNAVFFESAKNNPAATLEQQSSLGMEGFGDRQISPRLTPVQVNSKEMASFDEAVFGDPPVGEPDASRLCAMCDRRTNNDWMYKSNFHRSTPSIAPLPHLRSMAKLNCITIDEYKKRKFSFQESHCTIDVILADGVTLDKSATTAIPIRAASTFKSPGLASTSAAKEDYEPVRFIQINSPALCKLIGHGDIDQILIFAPFKSLCYDKHKLIAQFAERKWKNNPDHTFDMRSAHLNATWKGSTTYNVLNAEHPDGDNSHSAAPPGAAFESHESALRTHSSQSQPIKPPCTHTTDGSARYDVNRSLSGDETATPTLSLGNKQLPVSTLSVSQSTVNGFKPQPDDDTTSTLLNHPQATDPGLGLDDKEARPNDNGDVDCGQQSLTPEDRNDEGFKAYEDLNCLLEFHRRFVEPRWEHLRNGQVRNIRFGDLCYLFQPGDEVLMPEGAQQVWRVLKITGGRPMREHLHNGDFNGARENQYTLETDKTEEGKTQAKETSNDDTKGARRSKDRGLWSSFHIDGYSIDFDGKEFGAVHMRATIKYFPGERDVRTVRPYPLRLAEDYSRRRQEYKESGRRFLELTTPSLRQYSGRTLPSRPNGESLTLVSVAVTETGIGETVEQDVRPEDISSQVYVDMGRTFQVCFARIIQTA